MRRFTEIFPGLLAAAVVAVWCTSLVVTYVPLGSIMTRAATGTASAADLLR